MDVEEDGREFPNQEIRGTIKQEAEGRFGSAAGTVASHTKEVISRLHREQESDRASLNAGIPSSQSRDRSKLNNGNNPPPP